MRPDESAGANHETKLDVKEKPVLPTLPDAIPLTSAAAEVPLAPAFGAAPDESLDADVNSASDALSKTVPTAADAPAKVDAPPAKYSWVRGGAIAGALMLGAIFGFSQLTGGDADGTRGDASTLMVVASDLVTDAKARSGAIDAIGGYLPGTGIVLTIHLDELGDAGMEGWVRDHIDAFADRLALLPDNESLVVTVDSLDSPTARVWSLDPGLLARSDDWKHLVAPATFVSATAAAAESGTKSEIVTTNNTEAVEQAAEQVTKEVVVERVVEQPVVVERVVEQPVVVERVVEQPVVVERVVASDNLAMVDRSGDGGFYDADLWEPIFGSWALSDGVYAQTDATGYGYASEYVGSLADEYDVAVSMRAPSGDMNAGIIIGMPESGRKNGATVIDFTAEGSYLRWGAYDDETGDWEFIGGAPVDPPIVMDENTRLKLEVRSDRTGIVLNGEQLATIDPVDPGGLALVVSVANIEFSDFDLTPVSGGTERVVQVPVTQAPVGQGVVTQDVIRTTTSGSGGFNANRNSGLVFEAVDDSLVDWQALSGTWTASDGIITQSNAGGYDQMLHLLDSGSDSYRYEVRLRASPDSTFSGGLLYNIERPGVRANSYVLDIVNDGQDVRWATYDSQGAFTYLGGLRIADGFDAADWHTLGVEVVDGRARFFVDGIEIGASRDVGTEGSVGLVTSLASMQFTDVFYEVIE